MQLISILATTNNGIIGINNKEKHQYTIPWKISSDMKHFKSISENNILIMGSTTYESLPAIFFKDTSRKIIVLTGNRYRTSDKKNIFIGHSKDHAMKIAYNLSYNNTKKVIICGGKEIYELFLPNIHQWIVSHINTTINSHTHDLRANDELINVKNILSHIKNNSLKITKIKSYKANKQNEYDFDIISYEL